jgi:SAM-dependent methyltransferase
MDGEDERGGQLMHESSLHRMYKFLKEYLKQNDKILDVGSAIVQEGKNAVSYKSIIRNGFADYTGLDIEPGRNVDLVVKDPYDWKEVEDDSYDIVISGQALEHSEFFWIVFKEMARVLKPGGYMCLIVPKYHLQHRHPVDCWRFLPDGMRALAKYAHIKCLYANADHIANILKPAKTNCDCFGIFQK